MPLLPLPDTVCQDDIQFHKERGNYKSTLTHSDAFQQILQEDVERGFALKLPFEISSYIPHSSLASLGCQEQTTQNTTGERVSKLRMTYEQSFLGPSVTSVNMIVDSSKLPSCMYGYFLWCTIHYILGL